MRIGRDMGLLVGRSLLALSILAAGFQKMKYLPGAAAYLESVRVPGASVWLALALAVIEFAGALAIAVGFRTRLAAQMLIVYMVPAVWFTHVAVAQAAGDLVIKDQEFFFALKNLSIVGGLLLLSVAGPGKHSIDGK